MVGRKILMMGKFFDSWNWKNRWRERIPNRKKMCSELAGTHFTIRKIKFGENSGVHTVRNWINPGKPRNSKRISQPIEMRVIWRPDWSRWEGILPPYLLATAFLHWVSMNLSYRRAFSLLDWFSIAEYVLSRFFCFSRSIFLSLQRFLRTSWCWLSERRSKNFSISLLSSDFLHSDLTLSSGVEIDWEDPFLQSWIQAYPCLPFFLTSFADDQTWKARALRKDPAKSDIPKIGGNQSLIFDYRACLSCSTNAAPWLEEQ